MTFALATILFMAAATGLHITIFSLFYHRRLTDARHFLATSSLWAILTGMALLVPSLQAEQLLTKLLFICMSFVPVWYYAASTGGNAKGSTLYLLLFLEPIVMSVLAATNQWHSLIWKVSIPAGNDGAAYPLLIRCAWFWVHGVYSSGLILLAGIRATKRIALTESSRVAIVTRVAVAGILPWAGYIAHHLDGLQLPWRASAPIMFLGAGIVLSLGISSNGMNHYRPKVSRKILENVSDGVILVDPRDTIVDYNATAIQIISAKPEELTGKKLTSVVAIGYSDEGTSPEAEYEVRRFPIKNWAGRTTGGVVVLRDLGRLAAIERYRNVEIINHMTLRLAEASPGEDIYQILSDELRTLAGAVITTVSLFHEESSETELVAISAEHSFIDGVRGIIGRRAVGMRARLKDDELKSVLQSKVRFTESLTDLTFGTISRRAASLIKILLDAPTFVGIGLSYGNTLIGTALLAFGKHATIPPEELLKTLSVVAGVSLRRAMAEKALADSESRYRSIIQQSPLGIYQTTPEGEILTANSRLVTMLGYESLEALRSSNLEQGRFNPEYSRSEFKREIEKTGEITGLEAKWMTADNRTIYIRENARAIRNSQGGLLYEGTVEDITAHLRSEELFQILYTTALDLSRATTTEEVYHAAGESLKKNGYGMEVAQLDESRGELRTLTGTVGTEASTEDWTNLRRHIITSGEPAWWPGIIAAPLFSGGAVFGVITIYSESLEESNLPVAGAFANQLSAAIEKTRVLDDLRSSLAQLEDTQARLVQSQRMEAVGSLSGGIAHDFNNILTVIQGYSSLALASLPDQHEARGLLTEVEKASERASSLTAKLLAFSRKQVLQPVGLDLNVVIRDFVGMLERLIGEDVELSIHACTGSAAIFVDPGSIEQIIMNLVVNSRKAMPSGGKLMIRTETHKRGEHRYVRLEIEDNGTGIDPALLGQIFEPFFTTREVGEGSGLGLSMVHGLATQNGGEIEVDSTPGKGTRMIIDFPFHRMPVSQEARSALEQSRGVGSIDSAMIVLVEDERGVRKLIENVLTGSGHHVRSFQNPEEALGYLLRQENTIDALITDVIMPKISGPGLVLEVQKTLPDLPVLYISGYTDDVFAQQGIQSIDGPFLQKPFAVKELLDRVQELLSSSMAARRGA
jgi:PAS domain S-box-containing protein